MEPRTKLLSTTTEILADEDPEGLITLIRAGNPRAEYRSEAKRLIPVLNSASTAVQIEAELNNLFSQRFHTPADAELAAVRGKALHNASLRIFEVLQNCK